MPSTVASDVSRLLESVCRRAVSPSPKDRPSTALDLEQMIVEAARGTLRIADPEELGTAVLKMFEAERADSQRQLQERLGDIALSERTQSGRVTALAVHVDMIPCHIASLPVAVNIQCHAHRHKEGVI